MTSLQTMLHPAPARTLRSAVQSGFTLLEILIVLVIIGLLAGLVGPRLLGQLDRAKVTTAEAQIKMLKGALETMRLDIGRFPTADEGLQLLAAAPSNPQLRQRWRGPYIDGQLPLDPWSNPYQYDPKGRENNPFALYSFGPEGKDGKPGEGGTGALGYLPP